MSRPAILCLASYHKGDRFLCRCHEEGWHVILLTAEGLLTEPWPREAIHEVFAMPSLADRRAVINYHWVPPDDGKFGKPSDWVLVVRTPSRLVEVPVKFKLENIPLP